MAYATELETMWLENIPSTPTVQGVILIQEGGLPTVEVERVSAPAPNFTRGPLVFPGFDGAYWAGKGALCLLVQDASNQTIFRSHWMDPLPTPPPADPNGHINVLVPDVQKLTIEDMNAQLATRVAAGEFNAPPEDASLVVTNATLTLNSGSLTLIATGTRFTGGFVYTTSFTIEPVGFPFYGPPINVKQVGTATISFTSGTGHGLETFLLNLFSGVIADNVTRSVLSQIQAGLNDTARNEVARIAGASGGASGPLPPEVSVELRRCVITPSGVGGQGPGIYLWAAVGSFGSLTQRLFPNVSTSGRKCALTSLIPMGLLAVSSLATLRSARDEILHQSAEGSALMDLYSRHTAEIALLLEDHPELAAEAGAIAERIAEHAQLSQDASPETLGRVRDLLRRMFPLASDTFRDDVVRVSRAVEHRWPLGL